MKAYIAIPADFCDAVACETAEGASAVALSFGEGAYVVDTLGAPYHPAVQQVIGGQLMLEGFGSFNPKRGPSANLFEAVKKKQAYAARAFLAVGADVNATEKDGATPLHWAVGRGCADCVRVLMAAGADADARDTNGQSPRKLAQEKGDAAIIALLG
ncbi:MAG: ankyrin repeat domain-containing protein [Rhodospirillales bacterium]|nr:ankyrin repeat domain-containing protein [Rhodospirillales bacterium]